MSASKILSSLGQGTGGSDPREFEAKLQNDPRGFGRPSRTKTGVAPARPLTPRPAQNGTRRSEKSLGAFD